MCRLDKKTSVRRPKENHVRKVKVNKIRHWLGHNLAKKNRANVIERHGYTYWNKHGRLCGKSVSVRQNFEVENVWHVRADKSKMGQSESSTTYRETANLREQGVTN
jgi:hypothetical protein